MKYILSFSGGKDSLATLIVILKKGLPLDEIVFCNTGVEHKEVLDVVEKVKYNLPNWIKFVELKEKNFIDILKDKKFWPIFNKRWCTDIIKNRQLRDYIKKYGYDNVIQYVGFAYDEIGRTKGNNFLSRKKHYSFPLIDYKITEKKALKMCYEYGINWNGLYNHFDRLGCYLCPLMKVKDVKSLIINYPEKWNMIKQLEKITNNKWKHKGTEYYESKYKQCYDKIRKVLE